MARRVGSNAIILLLTGGLATGCGGQASSPLVVTGSHWRATTSGAPNLELASDGTGKMTYAIGASAADTPVAFTWQASGANTLTIALKTGPMAATPMNVQASFGPGGGAQYATTDNGAAVQLTWDAVPGADFYTVYKQTPGGTTAYAFTTAGDWTSSDFLTGTSFVDKATGFFYNDNGLQQGCMQCGVLSANYDGAYTYVVTATKGWAESASAKVTVTIAGFPAPMATGGGGAPSEGCSCPFPWPSAPVTNRHILDVDPTRLANLLYDDPASPTAFTADVVTASGTQTWKYTLASGSF